jgi:hypothetical protein
MSTKKILFVILAILLLNIVSGQKKYIRYECSDLDNNFELVYKNKNIDTERDSILDRIAYNRCKYSLDVIQESSNNIGFKSLLSNLEGKKIDHTRYFGKPLIFKEPIGCKFQDRRNLPELKKIGYAINSELMIHDVVHIERKNNISDTYLLNIVMSEILSTEDSINSYILNQYMESPAHNLSIKKFGNYKFGSQSSILISREFDKIKKVWKFDILLCNIIVLMKSPIN